MTTHTIRDALYTLEQAANRGTAVYVSSAIVQKLREALEAEPEGEESPSPSGYAYRYPSFSGSVLRFNSGQEVNGCRPIEAVPYWFAPPSDCASPAAPPAQEPGGVGELVSLLKSAGRWATSTGVHLDRFAALLDQQQAELAALRGVPVAVSERPWEREEWCDEQGRCWLGSVGSQSNGPGWVYRKPHEILHQTISLPHNAIPLPAPQTGEGEA